jgi:hypothetical protein
MSHGVYPPRKLRLGESQDLDDRHEARRARLWIKLKRKSETELIFFVMSAMSSRTSSGLIYIVLLSFVVIHRKYVQRCAIVGCEPREAHFEATGGARPFRPTRSYDTTLSFPDQLL